MAEGLQAKMASEQTMKLKKQLEELKDDNSRLMKAARASDGLRRVKVKLDESEIEMVLNGIYHWTVIFNIT